MKFEVRTKNETYPGRSLAAAHAKLGELAGRNGWDVHVHEGDWGQSSYSTAYTKGGDEFLDCQAVVARTK